MRWLAVGVVLGFVPGLLAGCSTRCPPGATLTDGRCQPDQSEPDGAAPCTGDAGCWTLVYPTGSACGNGTIDADEDCDDGNADSADGCTIDCKFSCTDHDDCDNGDACDGVELCNPTTHRCRASQAPNCDDSDPCTEDICSPSDGCQHTFIDLDGDGFAAAVCSTTGLRGGDCDDSNPDVRPDQYRSFHTGYCRGRESCLDVERRFDYNCDGAITSSVPPSAALTCSELPARGCSGQRWADEVPSCGTSATLQHCAYEGGECRTFEREASQRCR